MGLARRRFLQLAAGAAALPVRLAKAQSYPTRPVRIIIGFGPGASGDIAARVLAQALTQRLGQQFIVENRSGAGSNIATNFVAHAPNDGYTLLQGTVANTINPVITPNLGFDFVKDFAPISLFSTLPNIVVCTPRSACIPCRSSSSSRARNQASCPSGRRASAAHRISPANCST